MPLIVFDLDGTLIDSQRDLADSANELIESLGGAPLPVETVASMVGDGARVLVERSLAAAGLDQRRPGALDEFLTIYDRRLAIHTRFYPSLLEMLRPLSERAALSILTNKPDRHTTALLNHFGVADLFRWVIGGDSGFPRKPDPGGLLHVAREWFRTCGHAVDVTSPEPLRQVLFVGDSQVDVETGRNAGIKVCVAAYGFGRLRGDLFLDGSELVAKTPQELPAVIEGFLAATSAAS